MTYAVALRVEEDRGAGCGADHEGEEEIALGDARHARTVSTRRARATRRRAREPACATAGVSVPDYLPMTNVPESADALYLASPAAKVIEVRRLGPVRSKLGDDTCADPRSIVPNVNALPTPPASVLTILFDGVARLRGAGVSIQARQPIHEA